MTQRSRDSVLAEFWQQFGTAEPPELTSGPRPGVLDRRAISQRIDAFLGKVTLRGDSAALMRAATLLYHDHQDDAHDLVADRTDGSAAFLHGIVHRREPDYWNAKYWFRQCELHPAHSTLAARLATWSNPQEVAAARALTLPGTFDPFAFVDACDSCGRVDPKSPQVAILRKIQHAEFEAIVQHLLA